MLMEKILICSAHCYTSLEQKVFRGDGCLTHLTEFKLIALIRLELMLTDNLSPLCYFTQSVQVKNINIKC